MKHPVWKMGFLGMLGLLFSCAEVVPPDNQPGAEDCTNGLDDDADSFVDCQDLNCANDPACANNSDSESNCADGVDNDADFQTDCQDPDCAGNENCVEICGNSRDDDFDTEIDCQDPDCDDSPNCAEICNNGFDDDADGKTDCADSACAEDPVCNGPGVETNCANGQDDDFDGQTDCQDSDCANQSVCQAPVCNPANDQCTGNDICIIDECEPAFGRSYTFSNFEVFLANTNESGGSWDPFNGAPDPKVEVFINNQKILETDEAGDTFSASYSDTATAVINANTLVRVSVLDVDFDADDFAVTCESTLPASLLRARALLCQNEVAALLFEINPN